MRLFTAISIILLFAVAGCSTSYHTTSQVDDIYYTPKVMRPGNKEYKEVVVVEETRRSDNSVQQLTETVEIYDQDTTLTEQNKSVTVIDDEGNVYIAGYQDNLYDDLSHFAYSSRIRRFYWPVTYGSYYDPFYTNMYWYNFDPYYAGVSIYMGYDGLSLYYPGLYYSPSFFHRYYHRPFWSYHYPYASYWSHYYGFGWSYDPFFYGHYYSPFGYYYHPFYYSGYYGGYYSGFWHNPYYAQYFYNSYDRSNYHYGHRESVGSSTRTRQEATASAGSAGTFADRFETATSRNADGTRQAVTDRRPSRGDTRTDGEDRAGSTASSRPQRAVVPDSQGDQPRIGESTTRRITDNRTTEVGDDASRPNRAVSGAGGMHTGNDPQRGRVGETQARPQTSTGDRSGTLTRPTQGQANVTRPQTGTDRQQGTVRPQTPTERYNRPQQASPDNRSGSQQPNYTPPRTYTSPSYQQPRSNQQYRNPQSARPAAVTPPREAVPANREQTRPQNQPQQRTSPQTPTQRGQTMPQARPQAQPERQQAQPRQQPSVRPSSSPRSSPSVSPSRSSGSSVAPSRSSGSSSGAVRSSGSSSGSSSSRSSGGSSSGRRQ